MNRRDAVGVWPPMRLLLLIGGAAFFIGGVILAPASLLAPVLTTLGAPLAYERMEGSLWRGKIVRLFVGDQNLGDISFAVSPPHILVGRLQMNISMNNGAAVGVGRVAIGLVDRLLELKKAEITFDLSSIKKYTIFGVPYQGDLRAVVHRFAWNDKGCRIAEAEIWTNLLDASSRQFVGEGMEMSGELSCDGNRLNIALNGENAEGKVDIAVALTPNLTYEFIASVQPKRAVLQKDLIRLGFEDNGRGFVYDAIGDIKGLGS